MVLLAIADAILCFSWERMLRGLLPALRPPIKGYMAHWKELGHTSQMTDLQMPGQGRLAQPLDLDKLE